MAKLSEEYSIWSATVKSLPKQLTHLSLWKPLARWLPWGGGTAHFDAAKLLFYQSVATQHYIDNFAEGVERWRKAWRDYSAQSRSHVSHNDILLDVLAANLKFMAKDYDAAIPLYESAIQAIEPRRNRIRKGATLRARGSDLDYCNSALAILRYNLAIAKTNQGRDLEDAITILKCAIEEDLPDWVVLYRGLGDVYVEQRA
jgi:tetratricopeptide (TPR) repeat protein